MIPINDFCLRPKDEHPGPGWVLFGTYASVAIWIKATDEDMGTNDD